MSPMVLMTPTIRRTGNHWVLTLVGGDTFISTALSFNDLIALKVEVVTAIKKQGRDVLTPVDALTEAQPDG